MSTQPIDYDALAAQHGGTAAIDYDALAAAHGGTSSGPAQPEKRSLLDRLANDPNNIPLDSYTHATEHGLASIGQGVAQAIQGVGNLIRHPINTVKAAPSAAAALPRQAAALIKDPPTLQQLGDVAGQTAGQIIPAVVLHEAPGVAQDAAAMTPNAMRTAAGDLFQKVTAKAGNFPVDVEAPGSAALRIKQLADRGGSMPMVVRKFLNRVTAPDSGPLTYSEARDFYSNATRLSADETNRLTPKLRFEVTKFTRQLGSSIQQAADDAGVGAQHAQAMGDYARAMNYADKVEAAKQLAGKGVRHLAKGAATTAVGYEIYKGLKD